MTEGQRKQVNEALELGRKKWRARARQAAEDWLSGDCPADHIASLAQYSGELPDALFTNDVAEMRGGDLLDEFVEHVFGSVRAPGSAAGWTSTMTARCSTPFCAASLSDALKSAPNSPPDAVPPSPRSQESQTLAAVAISIQGFASDERQNRQ